MSLDDFNYSPEFSPAGGSAPPDQDAIVKALMQPQSGLGSSPDGFPDIVGQSQANQDGQVQQALDQDTKMKVLQGLHDKFGGPSGTHQMLNNMLSQNPDLQGTFGKPGTINAQSLDRILAGMSVPQLMSLMNRFSASQTAGR